MRSSRFRKTEGSIFALSTIVALVFITLLMSSVRSSRTITKQGLNIDNELATNRLAESALNTTLGKLIVDSSLNQVQQNNPIQNPDGSQWWYSSTVTQSNFPSPCHYIVTSASRQIGGQITNTKVHAYVELSNISEYFVAVNDLVAISHGADIGQGKIYGVNLDFRTNNPDPAAQTLVQKAEYFGGLIPAKNLDGTWDPKTDGKVVISEPSSGANAGLPVQLTEPLTFPQITDADLDYYKELAKKKRWNLS